MLSRNNIVDRGMALLYQIFFDPEANNFYAEKMMIINKETRIPTAIKHCSLATLILFCTVKESVSEHPVS